MLGQARENFGYAGGVNACIRLAMPAPAWNGVWALNPDTAPEPGALKALVSWCHERDLLMAGSRIMFEDDRTVVGSRGLRWRLFLASTKGVGLYEPASDVPNPDELEESLHSPSGASVYVTRKCIDKVGLMDERYFLYFGSRLGSGGQACRPDWLRLQFDRSARRRNHDRLVCQ